MTYTYKIIISKVKSKIKKLWCNNDKVNRSGVLWKDYRKQYAKYENNFTQAFPYIKAKNEDVPRYIMGNDGYWYNPQALESGKAVLSCTGDIMCEPRQHRVYKYGDSYFFHPQFKYVRGVLKKSDFVVGNLETTLSDHTPYADELHKLKSGGYHCNGPECYLDAIRYAGFDALVNANNHNCDSAVMGLVDTLDALDKKHFMHTGTFHPSGDERVLYVNVNGIKLGIISYATYFNKIETNFTKLGRDILLNKYSKKKAEADISEARSRGAEFIIVYMHWGREYTHTTTEWQKKWAQELADVGVDYIVGSHTHCLGPHDVIETADGRKVPVVYSMGNFVTNESKDICKHTGILQLVLEKVGNKTVIKSESFIPCYVFDEFMTSKFAVVPTNIQLNGGFFSTKLDEADEYIRDVMGELPVLETATITISELCATIGVQMPENIADRTLTRLCSKPENVTDGSGYFGIIWNSEKELETVQKKGAAVIITDHQSDNLPCVVVDDINEAFCKVYTHIKSRFKAKTIVITGSVGKTTTKEVLEKVMGDSFITMSSPGNWNTRHTGMIVMQQLRKYHEVYIQEVHEGDPNSARMMSRALMPDCAIITNIGQAHMENFKSKEEFRKAFIEISEGMRSDGVLFVNGDDEVLMDSIQQYARNKFRIVTFGLNAPKLDFRAENLVSDGKKIKFDLAYGEKRVAVEFPSPVEANAYSVLSAFAVGLECGIDEKQMLKSICKYESSGIRQNVMEYQGLTLFLDCRSATPASMRSSIESFCSMPLKKRASRIAVLGDMHLGEESEEEHKKIGQLVATKKIDWLFCFGDESKYICNAAIEAGFNQTHAIHFETKRELEIKLCKTLKQGDALLIKGGRRMYMNTIIRKLFGINYKID